MGKITVTMDPEQRQKYIDMLLELDGLSHVQENPNSAYCPISLTSTPDELKKTLKSHQELLMENVLQSAGITAYDPGSAPFSPDTNLTSLPNEVYLLDSGKIVGSRFFVGHNLLASTGQGIEAEKAKIYNRISVILMNKNIRVSRMQPHRAIYLQYSNFENEVHLFAPIFKMLLEYEPGMGFNGHVPVLLGFEKKGNKIIDLEESVYREFPALQYKYDGTVPILRLRSENPELFYSNK
ncbi:hypothetical protein KKC32_03945 [Patescibacteria group bacterium]|nr:hypothetical protein [Patescibacteria group bacterium]